MFIFHDAKNECYRFAKVLAAYPENGVVFIRTYKQYFTEPPSHIDLDVLSVGSFADAEGPTIGCAPIAYSSVHEQWINSPDYGISDISNEEIEAVKEAIDMMNEI